MGDTDIVELVPGLPGNGVTHADARVILVPLFAADGDAPHVTQTNRPTIAMLDGDLGTTHLEAAMRCDLLVAGSDASFGLGRQDSLSAEAMRSLLNRLPFSIVASMVLCGPTWRLSAARGHQLGLIDATAPGGKDAVRRMAREIARGIAANSPAAVRWSRDALWQSTRASLPVCLAYGARLLGEFWNHPDSVEGPAAFNARRAAKWMDLAEVDRRGVPPFESSVRNNT